jgi:hypothetical protein
MQFSCAAVGFAVLSMAWDLVYTKKTYSNKFLSYKYTNIKINTCNNISINSYILIFNIKQKLSILLYILHVFFLKIHMPTLKNGTKFLWIFKNILY